jgi:DNA-binding transcriptional ArsR family regulator
MAARKHPRVPAEASSSPGRFAYDGLDRVFHEKARLGIMTSLVTRDEGLSFSDLKTLCALSDGNLNRHLAVLQEAEFVAVEKKGGGRGSRTLYRVSRLGRSAFLAYLAELERVLTDASQARGERALPKATGSLQPGWSTS